MLVIAVCRATSNVQRLLYRHTKYFCISYVRQEKWNILLYDINWLLFIVEVECVYYMLRTIPFNKSEVNSFYKDLNKLISND